MKYMVYDHKDKTCDLRNHAEMYPYWNQIKNMNISNSIVLIEYDLTITRVE